MDKVGQTPPAAAAPVRRAELAEPGRQDLYRL
jgi:hypothetical protein